MIQKVEISWRHREQEGVIPVEVVYSRRRTIGLEIKADGHVSVSYTHLVADRVLTLPCYADLELEDVDRICGIIRGM